MSALRAAVTGASASKTRAISKHSALEVAEDVILVGERDEEVSLATGLMFAVLQGGGRDGDAGGVGRKQNAVANEPG